ncbi:hypothetical protein BMS3Bbin10_00240 [bacterium BMS3Bbin10]|nr:hypothetical protein BMS3Bbin10_00240 [bacterium BMS3Bbin10]
MARASKAKSKQGNPQALTEATASAAGTVLRAAAVAGAQTGKAGNAATITHLAHMCEEAASHMAKAQTSMFGGKAGGETAIEHLDAALQCLNRLADEAGEQSATRDRAAKSA